jgi:hypothetical protein
MLGAIAGDIIGSVYEGKKDWHRARTPARGRLPEAGALALDVSRVYDRLL